LVFGSGEMGSIFSFPPFSLSSSEIVNLGNCPVWVQDTSPRF
jgi:hypothetical protein